MTTLHLFPNSPDWAVHELQTADFGDRRLTRRLATLVTQLSACPATSVPQANGPNEGNSHVRGRFEGTFQVVTAAGTFTGTFKSAFNENLNRNNLVASFKTHVTGTDADGDVVKANFHGHVVIMEGEREPRVEFFKINCVK